MHCLRNASLVYSSELLRKETRLIAQELEVVGLEQIMQFSDSLFLLNCGYDIEIKEAETVGICKADGGNEK
jgi:hypothetical protein